jgi:hypothetical protein
MLRAGEAACALYIAVPQDKATGLDRAGRERIDPYVLSGMVDRHGPGELDDCTFRRTIGSSRRGRDVRQLRGYMNDAATTSSDHRRQHCPAHQERAGDIHGENPRPDVCRDIENGAVGIIGCGGVNQNGSRDAPRFCFPADVAAQRQRISTAGSSGLFCCGKIDVILAPTAANVAQIERPMRPPAPVTIATLPLRIGSLMRRCLIVPQCGRDRLPGPACLGEASGMIPR